MIISQRLKKYGYVLLEAISGLVFAILGGYIFSFFDKGHITASVINTFLVIFISIIIGIGIVGYFHLRSIEMLAYYGKSMVFSFIGLIVFLLIYIIIVSLSFEFLPYYISSVVMPVILPLIGAVVGFNLLTLKRRHTSTTA